MADTTIDLLKNSSYVGKMDELIAAVKSGGGTASDVEWDNVKNKPTTIVGYGITDAKIDNGTITLGNQTITPLTSAPVTSVNSKTGAVVLTANDVGALPNTTIIPDKTSQLDNDSGYITNSALTDYAKKTEIPTALPNPNALTFTGAVSGSYDGSTPLEVVIPSGGVGGGSWKQAGFVQSETDGETLEVTGLDTKSVRLLVCAAAYASDANNKAASIKINGSINLNYSGFIPLTTAKITVIEIYLITTTSGNYIFAPNFPTMRVNDTTAMSASYQVGNYSAWFLTRADTAEKIESISFACANGTLLAGSKLNVEVI